MNYPKEFQKLIDLLKLLPGVGEKTAERYAFSILQMPENKIIELGNVIEKLNEKITTCDTCGCLCENNNCSNCEKNDLNIICVVENQKNVFSLKKSGVKNLKYHVLGKLISPINGINPENINIASLINRVEKEGINEIILALKPGIEGTTTSLYINKILKDKNIKITQMAQGIPIGTDLEYLDMLTLELALENRMELS